MSRLTFVLSCTDAVDQATRVVPKGDPIQSQV